MSSRTMKKLLAFATKDSAASQREEDASLNLHAKKLEATKGSLKEIHESLAKRTKLTTPVIDNERKLGRAFCTFGDNVRSDDSDLGECLAKLGLMQSTLSDLMDKLNIASTEKLEEPINEFIKGEISAAEQEKKHYDKAKAAFEAADTKLRQLKSKEDAKAFDIEKERNVLQERFFESRDVAQTALADAYEKNKFYTLEKLCDYIDTQYQYFKSALEAVEAAKQKTEDYRRYIAKKKKEYRRATDDGQDEADSDGEDDEASGEVVRQGWLHRSVGRKGNAWKKSWVVIKYKYLYYYSNPDSSLGGVVRLTHCSVNLSTRKEFCFAINGRLSSQFFYAKTESDMQQWIDAIKSCIKDEEAHETRQLGKDEIKGSGWIEEDDEIDEPEEDINVQDPIQKTLLQLIRDEKKYLNGLTRLNKMYMLPLTADPKLKGKIQAEEVGAIFGNIKPLTMLHQNLLKQFEGVGASGVSAVFLHNMADIENAYISYLSKLSSGMYALNACKQRVKAIKQFLTEREEILGEGNELATLLALPVQRISQYVAVLQQFIMSGSPDPTLDEAHQSFKKLIVKLDQCSASSASLGKILEVRRRLHNYDGNLVDPQRKLLREGPAHVQLPAPAGPAIAATPDVKAKKAAAASYMFLFNDLLLFTKSPTLSRTTYKVVGQLEMHKANIADEESSTQFKLEEKQRGKHAAVKVYSIQCDPGEKVAWMAALLKSIEEMKETRKIYGIPLDQLMATSREKGRDVPMVIEKATEWIIRNALNWEGIFRKAGRLDSIEDYKDLFNQGKAIEFAADADAYVVAGVMNHFLMELPDPLLTNALYDNFIEAAKGPSPVEHLKELVQRLPPYNRYTLQHLMSFLQLVVSHEAENKMGPSNLSIVFGPTLLGSGAAESLFTDFTANQKVIENMICNYAHIFKDIEEERKLVKNKMIQEEQAEQRKREMQQRRITERLGILGPALRASASTPTSVSSSGSGEIPVRPSPPARVNYRKSILDPSQSPTATGSEAGVKPLPSIPPARKPLPRPPGSSDGSTSPPRSASEATPGSPAPNPNRNTVRIGTLPKGLPPVPVAPVPSPGSGSGISANDSVSTSELAPLIANIRSLTPGSVVKQGWLTKKGGQRRNWKTRWFVLKTNEFSYYNNKKDAKPKGTIVLSGITVKPSSHKEFCFAVSTTERTYLMAGKDATEQEEWITAITACLKSLDP